MKRTKTKKLVYTDGTWYYYNSLSGPTIKSAFIRDPKEAWNFNYEGYFSDLNTSKRLKFELDYTTHEPCFFKRKYGELLISDEDFDPKDFDIKKFKFKWITFIETIKEEDFNYEGFIIND